jgi:uncharacterized membrane protein YhaH (DUF805 family)
MTFREAVRTCVREKYADFRGRASRSEYWWFQAAFFLFLAIPIVMVIVGMMNDSDGLTFTGLALGGLIVLALFIPGLSVTARRLHDLDYSGWWYLLYLVLSNFPYVGFAVTIGGLVFVCRRGTKGPNRFGDDPLDPIGHLAEVFS